MILWLLAAAFVFVVLPVILALLWAYGEQERQPEPPEMPEGWK